MLIHDNGRAITANEIRKLCPGAYVPNLDQQFKLSYYDCVKMIRDHQKQMRELRNQDLAKRVGSAVAMQDIGSRLNGIADASVDFIKATHNRGPQIDRGDLMTKISFPPNSSNGSNSDTHAETGATNDFDDEDTMRPVTVRVGQQLIGIPSQANVAAASLEAVKQAMRNPKRYM